MQGVLESGINRRINRKKISYTELERELQVKDSLRARVYEDYKELLKIRRSEKVFNPTGKAKFYNENGVFIVERTQDNETIYCLHNFTGEEKNIEKYTKGKVSLVNEMNDVLGKYEFRWLKITRK